MVRQKQVAFTAGASTSKQKYTPPPAASSATPLHQSQQHVSGTPPGRAHTYTSLLTNTKDRLHDLDSGRCLITFEKTLAASQQAAHIVARRTKPTDLTKIEKMWKIPSLNLDSTKNLVTLRADWYLTYDNDWAFVPAEDILRKILKYKASSFNMPYLGFKSQELQDYVFVPLRILRRHYIFRQMKEFKEDDESEYGYDEQDEGEDEQHIENGEVTVHKMPFSRFPVLQHHAHPFFVIHNALPKLRKHKYLLRQEDDILLTLMDKINRTWKSRLEAPSPSKPGKRRRSSDDDDDEHDDKDAHDDRRKRQTKEAAERGKSGADRTKIHETRSTVNVGKGKGKATARGLGKTTPAQPQESQYLPPTPTSQSSTVRALRTRDKFLFDDTSKVAAWAAAVAAAGPPEDMDETVIWSDEEEPVRSPIQTWDRWHIPYKQPKQWARFCSYDWAMYLYSLPLWMPPYDVYKDPVAGECVTDRYR